MHSNGDREVWDRKNNRVELFGHAVIIQPGETLTADYAILDMNARTMDARGNCVYVTADTIIYGEEMHFNLDTHTGTVVAGRVTNNAYALTGERINKLSDSRFQTHWGEYTTCQDCPQSWTLRSKDVDMEVDGYAYMTDVTVKLKDVPGAWFPYMILPMKKRRQTGFLFPQLGGVLDNGNFGVILVMPYFWAISDYSDMTFALGEYANNGTRATWEGRKRFEKGYIDANLYLLRDRRFWEPYTDKSGDPDYHQKGFAYQNTSPSQNRWALNVKQEQMLPFKISEKFRFTEVSDNFYPSNIGDVRGGSEAYIPSDLMFAKAEPDWGSSLRFRRIRNLLYDNPDPKLQATAFDPRAVQVTPELGFTLHDQVIAESPFSFGLSMNAVNFTRGAGLFDKDDHPSRDAAAAAAGVDPLGFVPGVDPIRKATRVSMSPTLYASVRPWDLFSVVPSLSYRQSYYSFSNSGEIPSLYRSYPLLQTTFLAQIEKVYEMSNPDIPRIKHLVRPELTYSYIPLRWVREDKSHPFISQMDYANKNGFYGYNFDSNDFVPSDNLPVKTGTTSFVPLGNSVTMGARTQVIRRISPMSAGASYAKLVEVGVSETINRREYDKPEGTRQPLQRFNSNLWFGLGTFTLTAEHHYYPYVTTRRNTITSKATYTFDAPNTPSLGVAYTYDRPGCREEDPACGISNPVVDLGFTLSDYLGFGISGNYNLLTKTFSGGSFSVGYTGPSKCWKVSWGTLYDPNKGWITALDLALNLSGSGFGGLTELGNNVSGSK